MRKFFSVVCFFLLLKGTAQNTIALPEIINYTREASNSGTQNWKIGQDKLGIMYFANNEGLLSFDGSNWKKYPLPNETIVRSLAIAEDGRIYIGSQSEFGYFQPDQNGILSYTSIKVPDTEKDFADIWDVIPIGPKVFFRAHRKLFMYSSGKVTAYDAKNWNFMGYANGNLIAHEIEKGMLRFQDGVWKPFLEKGALPPNARITSFTAISKDSALLTTLRHGMFILQKNELTSFNTPTTQKIAEENIYASTMISADKIAVATNMAGCFIINKKGEFIQRLSKQDGLQNNNVLSIFTDKDQNLWIGQDNGIDLVAYNQAIKHIYPDNQEHSAGYSALIHQNNLYIGTSRALFKAPLQPGGDLSFVHSSFNPVANSKGQVWSLAEINGHLLMAHNEGAYVVENNAAIPFDVSTGFWTFFPLSNLSPSEGVAAGTYNGMNFYHYKNGKFTYTNTQTFFESARFIGVEKNMAWVAHPYKGLYKIALDNGVHPTNTTYKDPGKILSQNRNFIYKVKNRIILSSDNGLFEYNTAKGDFEPSAYLRGIFGPISVQYLKEDEAGNIWFVSDKRLGVVEFNQEKPRITFLPELNNKVMANGYEHIYPYNSQNIFVAGEQGFYHINYELYKKDREQLSVLISTVKTLGNRDSTVFGGYQASSGTPKLHYNQNSLHFDFVSPLHGQQDNIEYTYYLKDFDKAWSTWSKKREKEYTYLPPGTYTFMVKARRFEGEESPVQSFRFVVLPPWYRTTWAYLVYALIALAALYAGHKWQRRKFIRQQERHAEEQKKLQYLHQLELERNEKEIIRLRNEKLEAEIQLKNTELASTTMNLVQKGEMLHKVKEEFQKLKKTDNKETSDEEYKKIMRMLEEHKLRNDWEQFAVHFDKVHSDFLVSLKEHYPKLTPSELKLCAYLRLNLSSKEIAQIMNITIKSVELSRYRLRKKLGIPGEISLFNFLLDFHSTANAV